MIIQRQSDGSYIEVGCIMAKNGDEINKIVDKYGNVYFEKYFTQTVSGYPCILENSAGKPIVNYRIYGNTSDGQSVGKLIENGGNSGKYEIPILCRGKNLFDRNSEKTVGYISSGGTITHNTTWFTFTKKIKCSGEITIQAANGLGTGGYINCYNYKGQFLGTLIQSSSNSVKSTINLIPDTYYIQTCSRDNNLNNYQIELGGTATKYEPYREPVTTSIFLDKPLKTGDILKYPENILVHTDGTEESIKLPKIPTLDGNVTIETDTEISPSNMEITYKSKK